MKRRWPPWSGEWQNTLGALKVKTPDDSFDVIVNGWLVHQTLSCRIWARSGPYQPGGAYGFRDQLQDVLALLWTPAGTVSGTSSARGRTTVSRGRRAALVASTEWARKRTRCSDDFLWLPYAVAAYVSWTGDGRRSRRTRAFS